MFSGSNSMLHTSFAACLNLLLNRVLSCNFVLFYETTQ